MIFIRKLILGILIIFSLISVSAYALPDNYSGFEVPVDVSINGSFIKCPEKAFVESGATYIPLRAFFDALGGTTVWNAETGSATVYAMGKTFVFYSDKNFVSADGLDYIGTTAKLYKNTMFVPVKFVCDMLNLSLNWDSFYYVAEITAPEISVPEQLKDFSYTKEDLLWLGKIVQIESGGEKIPTRIGVANAVVNRMRSPSYPNTIKDVILDTRYSVQFPPAHTDKINVTPSYISMIAAKCALSGTELVRNAVSFVNVNRFANSWVAKNLTHVISIGNLGFFAD